MSVQVIFNEICELFLPLNQNMTTDCYLIYAICTSVESVMFSTQGFSHYIEVAQGDIFMEQKMWFGRLAILKKNSGPIMSNFWGQFFMFWGAKRKLKSFWRYCSICTDKLHNISLRKKNCPPKTRKNCPQIG